MPPFSIAAIIAVAAMSSINKTSIVMDKEIASCNSQNLPRGINMMNLFSPEVPVLFIGAPGIGKTASIHAHFDYVEVMLASTMVEEDIAGLPYREGQYDYRTIPAMFRRLADANEQGKTTALFVDELDKSRRSVADTLLTLFVSRSVGAAKLPDSTCIVSAANPPEFGGGDGISEAMQSRFATIDFEPDVAAWSNWAEMNFNDAPSLSIINSIRNGEIPIFDMTGDGLSRRISAPRTFHLALNAMKRHGATSAAFEMLVRGLLTPAVASQALHLVRREHSDILAIATASAKRGVIKKSSIQPVRI
jgi:hypothetical protein